MNACIKYGTQPTLYPYTKAYQRETTKKELPEHLKIINIDLWRDATPDDIARADCSFYPNSCIYRGNVYDKNGRIIGDYHTTDSVEIETAFPGIFGE